MSSHKLNPATSQWHPATWLAEQALPVAWQDWLTDTGSLSKRLRYVTRGEIQHQLQQEGWEVAATDEYAALGVAQEERVWLRHIAWMQADREWVRARVVIPSSSMQGPAAVLAELHDKSLGDVIFTSNTLQRSPFEFCCIKDASGLLQWTRRSIFYFHQQPLLVAETFLPELLTC